jgi:ATP-binding cassette subfamily A (ABC1) protein 3
VILSNPDVARSTLEPYELNNIGGDLLALGLHCVIGLTLIIIVESFPGCIAKTRKPKVNQEERQGVIDLDEDVTAEEERVSKIEPKDCLIKVDGLKKVYKQGYGKSTVAIEKTSFAIDKGECFALLGVNGAGKTTTFKSLTREVIPTKGVLTVMGYDIQSQFNQARKYIGYCP